MPVTVTLLRSGLINTSLQDQQLAKLLCDPRPVLLNFAANLIRECLSSDPPVATQAQFAYSIEMFSQLSHQGKAIEEYVRADLFIRNMPNNCPTELTDCLMIYEESDGHRSILLPKMHLLWLSQTM